MYTVFRKASYPDGSSKTFIIIKCDEMNKINKSGEHASFSDFTPSISLVTFKNSKKAMASQYFPKQVTDRTYSKLMQPKTDYQRNAGDPHVQMNRHENIKYLLRYFTEGRQYPTAKKCLKRQTPSRAVGLAHGFHPRHRFSFKTGSGTKCQSR